MPYSPQTRRNDSAGTSKIENTQQVVDLFRFTGLHQLGEVLDDHFARPGRRGRKTAYPAAAMLGAVAAARVAGSQAEALKLLRRPDTWELCRAVYHRRNKDHELPAVPPNRDQVHYFRSIIAQPDVLELLQQRFQRIALGQARQLGNLLPGATASGTDPDERHSIYSDGTVIAPYSDVTTMAHPRTGEIVLIGSRAKSLASARMQSIVSDMAHDGKTTRGLNMVGVHTWTHAGRVVLATGKALGAEQWTVLDLIDSIHDVLVERDGEPGDEGGAIHTLINDRAITGWAVDYLMGHLGIQVLSKAVGKRGSTDDCDPEINDTDLSGRVAGLAKDYDANPAGPAGHILRRDVISEMLWRHEHLPVGLSIYPTKKKGFDLVHSATKPLPPARHDTAHGPCEHPLVLDDGALFLVTEHPEENYQVKTRLLPCQSSTRYRRAGGLWGTRNTYEVPCGGDTFDYVREWEATGVRFTASSPEKDRAPRDSVGWQLRPLNRADDLVEYFNESVAMHQIRRQRFTDKFSRRNDAESYNQWYQQSLPHHGRAASQSVECQELDFLLAGLLNNSIT